MKNKILQLTIAAMFFCSIGYASSHQPNFSSVNLNMLKGEKDPCKAPFYEINSQSLTLNSDKSGLSIVISLTLDDKRSNPATIKYILTLVDCKGNKQYVSVELKCNAKTGEWAGAQYLFGSSDCPWSVDSYSIIATNPCGDEYETEVDDQLKKGKLPARDRIVERRRRGQ